MHFCDASLKIKFIILPPSLICLVSHDMHVRMTMQRGAAACFHNVITDYNKTKSAVIGKEKL